MTVTLPGTVAEVGSSNSTEYALLADGRLYAWGLGSQGQLGDGGQRDSFHQPVLVRFPPGVKIASIPTDVMPYDSALAVDTAGRAWGWGDNGGGELCLGNRRAYRTPVRLPLDHVTALAGASNHAVYDAAGTVYACGQNVAGDLGDGSTRSSTTPVRVAGLDGSRVTRLVTSFANSGALLAAGDVLRLGLRCGRGSSATALRPVVRRPGPAVRLASPGDSRWRWAGPSAPTGRPS